MSAKHRQTNSKKNMGRCFFYVTFLTGDDLFMKLVAAVVELVCLPVSQKHFTAAHLHTQRQSQKCDLLVERWESSHVAVMYDNRWVWSVVRGIGFAC